MAENQTNSNFYGSPFYLQMRKIQIKNEGARVVTTDLPLQVYADFFMMLKGS